MTHGMTFVAFDVETANGDRGSMCAAGATLVSGGQIIEERSWFFRPTEPVGHFDPRNVSVHGIHPEDVAHRPHAMQALPEIFDYLAGHVVIAHNAAFDMSSIRATCDYLGQPYPSLTYGCTMVMSRKALSLSSNTLPAVTEHLGLDSFQHHDAGADSRAAAKIMLALAARHGAVDMESALGLIGVDAGILSPERQSPCRKREGGTAAHCGPVPPVQRTRNAVPHLPPINGLSR